MVPCLTGSTGRTPVMAEALLPFVAAVRQRCGPNRQLTHLLVRLAARPALVEGIITALRAHPALFAHCLRVNMGERWLWQLPVQPRPGGRLRALLQR